MEKINYIIFLCFFSLAAISQTSPDCFTRLKQQYALELEGLDLEKKISVDSGKMKIDSIHLNSLEFINKRILKNLEGCQLPDTTFRTWDGITKSIYDSKVKYTILNFNTVYCDNCSQLEELLKLKYEHKNNLRIVLFYFNSVEDLQALIDKYRDFFEIVPQAYSYYEKYTLGQGYPLTYLLGKEKSLKCAESGSVKLDVVLLPFLK